MKYLLLLSVFLVGCDDNSFDKQIVVDCQRKQVIQFDNGPGAAYFIKKLPMTVDSNCQVKVQTEGK